MLSEKLILLKKEFDELKKQLEVKREKLEKAIYNHDFSDLFFIDCDGDLGYIKKIDGDNNNYRYSYYNECELKTSLISRKELIDHSLLTKEESDLKVKELWQEILKIKSDEFLEAFGISG